MRLIFCNGMRDAVTTSVKMMGCSFRSGSLKKRTFLASITEELQDFPYNSQRIYQRILIQILRQMKFFGQFKYIPFRLTKPDFDLSLDANSTDYEVEVQQMINDFGATEVWLIM